MNGNSKREQVKSYLQQKFYETLQNAVVYQIRNGNPASAKFLADYLDSLPSLAANHAVHGYGFLELADIMNWKTRRITGR